MPDNEQHYNTARDWIQQTDDFIRLSNYCIVDDEGNIKSERGGACHASHGRYLGALPGTPVVHGEYFCQRGDWRNNKGKGLGEAGQRYFAWLCDNKKSLFSKWSGGGMEIVRDEDDKIVGGLWKNMEAPEHIVSQWTFAGRCPGEHNRAKVWDALVQAGLPPTFSFWAMHFFQSEGDVFNYAPVSHIGITAEDTIKRVVTRDPNLVNSQGAYKNKSGSVIFSNYIWRDTSFANPVSLFPKARVQSSSFGALAIDGYNTVAMADGLKRVEDKLKMEIKE